MIRSVPALALLLAITACADEAPPSTPSPWGAEDTVRLQVGSVPVDVRVVQTFETRRRGLMGVRSLGPSEGMLFVYPTPKRRQFWMRGCLIPLDIAFLDEAGTVLQVDTLQPPANPNDSAAETRRSPPAVYVLETRAGFFAEHGLATGTRVTIPASIDRTRADP